MFHLKLILAAVLFVVFIVEPSDQNAYELGIFDVESSSLGCDNVAQSGAVLDQCGVCNGDNSTCTLQEGRFRKQFMDFGYIEVVTLPAGARNINITELSASGNYLAIRKPNGPFYINGKARNGLFDRSATYDIDGVSFEYSRPYASTVGESILSNGPTRSDLTVLIFHQDQNPGIHYKYLAPNTPIIIREESAEAVSELRPLRPYNSNTRDVYAREDLPVYREETPLTGEYQPLRGGLTVKTERGTYTTNQYGGRSDTYGKELVNNKRYAVVRPLETEVSNRVVWKDIGLGQCSQSCAAGLQVSIIKCVINGTDEIVDAVHCNSPKPKPRVKICNRKACPPYYFAGPWSPCTKTCGYGRRTRSVTCRQEFAGHFMTTVSHRKCKDLVRLAQHERCMVQECARWRISSDWSECSASCGSGLKTRTITCMSGDEKVVSDSECPSTGRPMSRKSCNAGPCITRWFISEWDQCSADCDRGFQRRNVFCVNTANRPKGCSRSHQPNTTRNCARPSCGTSHEWFAGSWGPCSTHCGRGFQQRKVACISIHPNGTMVTAQNDQNESALPCQMADRPAIQQACNTKECGSKWHHTPWSECTKSCDGGKRSRMVQCLDAEGRFSGGCDPNTRPSSSEYCNTVACSTFENSTCVDTDIHRCRLILKSRFCTYPVYYKERCCRTCSQARKRMRSSPRMLRSRSRKPT